MNGFLKVACPHCGQAIEYPAEGTMQTVPCPTCEKPVTLAPAIQPQADDEAQRKKEWDEWIALNERLKQRRIQSGIPLPQDELPTNPPPVLEQKEIGPRSEFAILTEVTIRKKRKPARRRYTVLPVLAEFAIFQDTFLKWICFWQKTIPE